MTTDSDRLAALRELLPATGAGIYLATAEQGPLPAETAAAMRDADDWELRVGRAWAGRAEDVAQREEEARAVMAALLGTDPVQVHLAAGIDAALDLARHAGVARDRVLDATALAGVVPLDVVSIEADAVLVAADRWLLGPEGTAALWLRHRGLQAPGGRLPRSALIGLARSVGWLEMYVGLDWIFERTRTLTTRLHRSLAGQPGIELLETGERPAIVPFRLSNWTAEEAGAELQRRVFAILATDTENAALRASVAWFNTEAELDRFASVVAELAGHTPATLPRRAGIEML
jgi:selenocysteine lyase/cysteine desulfurase